jgi:hypothetical protein
LQDRRRKRQVSAVVPPLPPNAPVITNGGYEGGATAPGWFDLFLDWTFEHGSYPVADMEVWLSRNGGPFVQQATAPSEDPGYFYPEATESEGTYDFKVRYANGETVGPFSNVYQIMIQF